MYAIKTKNYGVTNTQSPPKVQKRWICIVFCEYLQNGAIEVDETSHVYTLGYNLKVVLYARLNFVDKFKGYKGLKGDPWISNF